MSPTTEKNLRRRLEAFRAWCAEHRAPYLPAPPSVVAAYLAHRAGALGRSGLRLILASVAFHHRRDGIEYGPVFPRLTAAGTKEGRLTGNGV